MKCCKNCRHGCRDVDWSEYVYIYSCGVTEEEIAPSYYYNKCCSHYEEVDE